jgi:hypothetical protein
MWFVSQASNDRMVTAWKLLGDAAVDVGACCRLADGTHLQCNLDACVEMQAPPDHGIHLLLSCPDMFNAVPISDDVAWHACL